jgi:hypothetical protein
VGSQGNSTIFWNIDFIYEINASKNWWAAEGNSSIFWNIDFTYEINASKNWWAAKATAQFFGTLISLMKSMLKKIGGQPRQQHNFLEH